MDDIDNDILTDDPVVVFCKPKKCIDIWTQHMSLNTEVNYSGHIVCYCWRKNGAVLTLPTGIKVLSWIIMLARNMRVEIELLRTDIIFNTNFDYDYMIKLF